MATEATSGGGRGGLWSGVGSARGKGKMDIVVAVPVRAS
jgi:hypothetical protein